jgi:uncharacterized protein YjeT (DUF2065 family)
MARRPRKGGSAPRKAGDGEPGWWERLEQQPVGQFGVGVVVVGWIVLAILTFTNVWPLEVTFFLAVGLLTLVLGGLALYAAVSEARRPRSSVLRPPDWLVDFEDYFRWLTPVAFFFGLVFAHYFWH